jgi:shikimate kinase
MVVRRESPRAVFLVGFMASGKTTVGEELARRLAWDFVDLDAKIEARAGQSVAEIFRARGESAFRSIEAATLRDLIDRLELDTVVALGGGTFAQADNIELLKPWLSIFLDAPVDELWSRSQIEEKKRPLRTTFAAFARLYQDRLPSYCRAMVTIVTTGKDQISLCEEIQSILQAWDKTASAVSLPGPLTRFETGDTK